MTECWGCFGYGYSKEDGAPLLRDEAARGDPSDKCIMCKRGGDKDKISTYESLIKRFRDKCAEYLATSEVEKTQLK